VRMISFLSRVILMDKKEKKDLDKPL